MLYQELCDGIDLLNSTFTFHLIPIVMNSLLLQVFSAYGILWAVLSRSKIVLFITLQNGSWFITQYMLQALMAFAGSSVTRSAKKSSLIIIRELNNDEVNEGLVNALQNLVSRMNSRSLKVENVLFQIDWRLFARVRNHLTEFKFNRLEILSDDINHHHLSGHHFSV